MTRVFSDVGGSAVPRHACPDVYLVSLMTKRSQWESSCISQVHQKAISALAVHNDLIVTGASDSYVKIWKLISSDEAGMLLFHCVHDMDLIWSMQIISQSSNQ